MVEESSLAAVTYEVCTRPGLFVSTTHRRSSLYSDTSHQTPTTTKSKRRQLYSPCPLPAINLCNLTTYWQVPPRFGLHDSSLNRWSNFFADLKKLNAESAAACSAGTGKRTVYKFILIGRHGQGYRMWSSPILSLDSSLTYL